MFCSEMLVSFILALFFMLLNLKCTNCGKILVVPAHISPSHAFPLFDMADALARRSHEVLIWYPTGTPIEMISRRPKIAKMDAFSVAVDDPSFMEMFYYENSTSGAFADGWTPKTDWSMMMALPFEYKFLTVASQEYQKAILRDHTDKLDKITQQNWDLIIVDDMFCPVGHLISELTDTPLIIYSTTMLQEGLAFNFGLPVGPSYLPTWLSAFPYGEMSFWQRIKNAIFVGGNIYLCKVLHKEVSKDLAEYLDDEINMKNYWEIRRSAAFIFVIFPAKLEYPRPGLSNVIHLGNPECKQMDQKMPKDLEKRVNLAKGVIIFAFGHHVSWKEAPDKVVENFAEAFGKFPKHLVVWKLDKEPPKNLPKNIIIMDFLPQPALLSHPKASVFITHGGINSFKETICAEVPVIGIPFGADHMSNLARITRAEAGLILPTAHLYSSQKITQALQNVLTSTKYKTNMAALKASFADDFMTALERAAFWSEFAIRHKGAGPLKSKGLEVVSTIAYYHLDFLAVAILFIYLIIHTTVVIISKCVRLLRNK